MKTSFWNFLTFIFSTAGILLAGIFYYVFNNPFSSLNPYPPPTLVSTSAIPTLTASPQSLPEVWTPTPEAEMITGTSEIIESSREVEETPVFQPTITPVVIINTQTESSAAKSVAPLESGESAAQPMDQPADTQETSGAIVITAPVGVFNNTWQKLQSIPSFSWKIPDVFMDIKNYQVFFSSRMDEKPAATVTKTHFSHPAVPSGEYFLRVDAIGTGNEVLETSPYFVFRYDDTPPTEPVGFGTTDPGNTFTPYFTWMASSDEHSGMTGGMSGYAIYQGPVAKCGKPVAFTTDSHWTPVTPLVGGTTEYFCIKALDAVGNESKWIGPISFKFAP